VIWVGFAAAAASLFGVTWAVCNRIRSTGWQNDLDSLIRVDDGYQHPDRTSER
jgi:hypothetical protein